MDLNASLCLDGVGEASDEIKRVLEKYGVTVYVRFIPKSQSRNAPNKEPTLNWEVILQKENHVTMRVPYSQGIGYHPKFKYADRSIHHLSTMQSYAENGRGAIRPTVDDILECLLLEYVQADSFEEWAEELGFNSDSIKDKQIYKECRKHTNGLNALFGPQGIEELDEICNV